MIENSDKPFIIPRTRKPLEPGQDVIIQTPHFRCMGHLDREGNWRRITGEKISKVISWEPLQADGPKVLRRFET